MDHTIKDSKSEHHIPDGFQALSAFWKQDLSAGFIVFLIALPLCIGIGMASAEHALSGIISAIVGGMVVTMISGSYITINGPAAGLIVLLAGAAETLGNGSVAQGYPAMLAAAMVAGGLLIAAGLLKMGKLAAFFPTTAVHGMLAAIGVIIMSKQAHLMLGVKPEGKEPLELIVELPHSFLHLNPVIAGIGILSLTIMILMPLIKHKYVKMIPPAFVVVVLGIGYSLFSGLEQDFDYGFQGASFHAGPEYLINLPDSIISEINWKPDFSLIGTGSFWIAVVMISLIQGIETMLSAKAVEKLDPLKRQVNMNRDLVAIGVGSMVSTAIGGLPVIAEIVRSSANINNGARSRWSNFFHGIFMLSFVLLLPGVIHLIPIAALAAILVYTGFKLTAPKLYKHAKEVGNSQLVIMVITLVATIATDLVIGVAIGIFSEFAWHIMHKIGFSGLIKVQMAHHNPTSEVEEIAIQGPAIFTGILSIQETLSKIPKGRRITLNMSKCTAVDHSTMEFLIHHKDEYTQHGGHFVISGLEKMIGESDHPLASRYAKKTARIKTVTLRQRQLMRLAEELGAKYDPIKHSTPSKYLDFPVASGKKIVFRNNRLSFTTEGAAVRIEDIAIRNTVQSIGHDFVFTVALIALPGNIPTFVLEEEEFLYSLIENFEEKDIDFTEYPNFSDRYLLKGKSESEIRQFFNAGLIQLMERQKVVYSIESNGHALLVHQLDRLMSADEIRELVVFSKDLSRVCLSVPVH